MGERPNLWSIIYGVLCIGFLVAALFVIDDVVHRFLAALFGLHFGNRSEIADMKAALSLLRGDGK